MNDFEKVSYLTLIKYIDTIAQALKNWFSDFKKIFQFLFSHNFCWERKQSRPSTRIVWFAVRSFKPGKLLLEERYPNLQNLCLIMGSMLGSMYLCESSFSNMKFIKSKYRLSLSDKLLTQLLRLSTTNINANIDTLVSENQHLQNSHYFFCIFVIFLNK